MAKKKHQKIRQPQAANSWNIEVVPKSTVYKAPALTKLQPPTPALPKKPKPVKGNIKLSATLADPDFEFPSQEEMIREYETLREMAKDIDKADMHTQLAFRIKHSKVDLYAQYREKIHELKERAGDLTNIQQEVVDMNEMTERWNSGKRDPAESAEYLAKIRKFKACKEMVDFRNEMVDRFKAILAQEAYFKLFGTLIADKVMMELKEERKEEAEKEVEEEPEGEVENPGILEVRVHEYINGVPFGWEPYREPDAEKVKAEKKAWKKMRKEWREQKNREIPETPKPLEPMDWTTFWVRSFIVLEFFVILFW